MGDWRLETGDWRLGIGDWDLGVEGGFDSQAAALEDVGVDHGGADVFMAEQFLNGSYVVAVLKEVGGEGVAEGVGADSFLDFGFFGGLFEGALQAGGVQVVTAFPAAARVERSFGGGEEVLPGKFTAGVRVFVCEGVGEVDFAKTG